MFSLASNYNVAIAVAYICITHLSVAQPGPLPVHQSEVERFKPDKSKSILGPYPAIPSFLQLNSNTGTSNSRPLTRQSSEHDAPFYIRPYLNPNAEPYHPLSDEQVAPYLAKLHATIGNIRAIQANSTKPKQGKYLTIKQRQDTKFLKADKDLEEYRRAFLRGKAEHEARKAMSAQKNVLSGEQDKKMKGDGNSSLPSIGEIKSQSLAPPSTSGKFETNAEKNIDSDKSQTQAAEKKRKGKGIKIDADDASESSSKEINAGRVESYDHSQQNLDRQFIRDPWSGSSSNKKEEEEVWHTVSKGKAAKIRSPPKGSFVSLVSHSTPDSSTPFEPSSTQFTKESRTVDSETSSSDSRSRSKESKGKKKKKNKSNSAKATTSKNRPDESENIDELIKEMRELDKKKSESEASKKVEDPKPSQPDDVGKIVHGVIDQLNKENSIKMKYRIALMKANPQQRKVLEKEAKDIGNDNHFTLQDQIKRVSEQYGINMKMARTVVREHHKQVGEEMEKLLAPILTDKDGKFDKSKLYHDSFGFRALKPEIYEEARRLNARKVINIFGQASSLDPDELT